MEKEQLIELAKKARLNSYSPYSNFAVGAALLCKDGSYFIGTNIENCSYPQGICAERTALFSAYANGKKKEDIIAFAVVADTDEPVSPCGMCRQVMNELLSSDCPIYLSNLRGDTKETTIEELLPFAFSSKDLNK